MAKSRRRPKGPRPLTSTALARYEAEQDAIVRAEHPDTQMPDVLYHYTNWPGFRGIVSSQHFHARAHDSMKDTAEISSLDSIIMEVAEELVRAVAPPLRPPLEAVLLDWPNRRIAKIARIYLACFSIARDKPSQWRSYAAKGTGVCLGFRALRGEKPPNAQIAAMPVTYDDDETWRARIRDRFGQVVTCHSRFGRHYRKGFLIGQAAAWSAFMRTAAIASIRAKKAAFASEEEWRVFLLDAEKLLTPLSRPDGTEYIELRLRAEPLRFVFTEILLGPRQELGDAQAIAAARRVLEEAGYAADEIPPISVSTIDVPEE